MKDEIKEILEDNGELMVRYKDNSFECFDTLPKNVVDYIINLQEENNDYNSRINALNHMVNNLQEENEILKQNAIHNDKVVDKAKWNEMIYKSRNEKAIEYNKTHYVIDDPIKFKNDMNDILNGGDDNG